MKLKMLAAFAIAAITAQACKSEEPAQQGGYPQTQPAPVGQPPAQPGYTQPAATPVATTPAPVVAQPTTPVAAAPAALSPPGPLALPCTTDAQCATAHCNTQFGKCVFPCQNDNDCIAPNRCMAGACLPAMPGQ
ncbi:MAG TPA: hypothetical protein VEQ58_11855 [Polyangiaceae bacterium]|nr:hypothetical protein [Polyangiaceae bacterium]